MSINWDGRVTEVELFGAKLTEKVFAQVSTFERLNSLSIHFPQGQLSALRTLRRLSKLEEVTLVASGPLDVAELTGELVKLPALKRVFVRAGNSHAEALARLGDQLPGVEVTWEVFDP